MNDYEQQRQRMETERLDTDDLVRRDSPISNPTVLVGKFLGVAIVSIFGYLMVEAVKGLGES